MGTKGGRGVVESFAHTYPVVYMHPECQNTQNNLVTFQNLECSWPVHLKLCG